MEQLKQDLKLKYPNLEIYDQLYSADPNTFIHEYAIENQYDCIVAGTSSLTRLKDMTTGSLTERWVDSLNIPIFIVPEKASFVTFQNLIIGVPDTFISNSHEHKSLFDFLSHINPSPVLNFVHVVDDPKVYENQFTISENFNSFERYIIIILLKKLYRL